MVVIVTNKQNMTIEQKHLGHKPRGQSKILRANYEHQML
jgi:hypothetical protein